MYSLIYTVRVRRVMARRSNGSTQIAPQFVGIPDLCIQVSDFAHLPPDLELDRIDQGDLRHLNGLVAEGFWRHGGVDLPEARKHGELAMAWRRGLEPAVGAGQGSLEVRARLECTSLSLV